MTDIVSLNEQVLLAQSRSFSIPILQLETRLKLPIMVEYNLNKFMDTIEDNPNLSNAEKCNSLQQFIQSLETEKNFLTLAKQLLKKTPQDEAHVFKQAEAIFELYLALSLPMKKLSLAYNQEMAKGMIHFLNQPILSLADLNHYCYYVAGTVGLYLTDVIHFYYPFKDNLLEVKDHAKGYGLFLQKLNILRDFHEDNIVKGRQFWPKNLLAQHPKETVFMMIVETILTKDIINTMYYYKQISKGAKCYIYFNRFIILSSLEYLKLILKKKAIFSFKKLKLSRLFISTLYNKIKNYTESHFIEKCEQLIIECKQLSSLSNFSK